MLYPSLAFRNTNLWTPAEINTDLWLDASDVSTITTVSGGVSEWRNKNGSSVHAIQGVAIRRPIIALNQLNNKQVISFPIASMDNPDFLDVSIGNYTDFTFLFVSTGNGNSTGPHFGNLNSNNDPAPVIFAFDNSISYRELNYTVTTINTISPVSNYSVYEMSKSGGTLFGGCNGHRGNTVHLVFTNNFIRIGARGIGGYANNFVGSFAEIVFFKSAITDVVRQKLEGYLAHRWGLVDYLPVTHPYKSTPPYK